MASTVRFIIILVTIVISLSVFKNGSALSPSFLKDYTNKICANEPSCKLINMPDLPRRLLTLETRDCMCDFECTEYNDCCMDSDYYKAPQLQENNDRMYYCSSESRVYMVVSCAADFVDESIKEKCSQATLPLKSDNTALILPVTNIKKRITYANAYCALCNNDPDFELWNLTAECGELDQANIKSSEQFQPSPTNTIATTTTTTSTTITTITTEPIVSSKKFEEKRASTTPFDRVTSASTSTNIKNKWQSFLQTKTKQMANIYDNLRDRNHFISTHPSPILHTELNDTVASPYPYLLPPFHNPENSIKINVKINSHDWDYISPRALFLRRFRRKRDTSNIPISNVNKYADSLSEILKVAKYDSSLGLFTAKYNNVDLVCRIGSKMPEKFELDVRQCVPDLISDCDSNDANFEENNKKCRSYTAIVYDQSTNKQYRNKDCAACQGVSTDKLKGCFQGTRTSAAGLFSTDTKSVGNAACSDPMLASKFC